MKCKHCDGDGVIVDVEYGHAGKYGCKYCDGKGVVEPLTNEEWFDTLSTEEKAKFMCNIYEMGKNGKEYFMRLDKCVEWLKQPHHESVTNCNE